MKHTALLQQVLTTLILLSLSFDSFSLDKIKVLRPLLKSDKRTQHKDEVIYRALEATTPEFGPFTFETVDVDMTPGRAFSSMKTGELINTYVAPANRLWDRSTIPIKIPIRKGLLSYRLLLINQLDLPKFEKVKTLDDLNHLTAGLQKNWATTKVFNDSNINMTVSHTFEGLFLMLEKQRFNYIPRAIYEVFDELNNRKSQLKNIIVEPNLALHIPMATFVYVSKDYPEIAKRIEAGLKKMVANGELQAILNKYYAEDIDRANLETRRIIEIKNPYFDEENQSIIEDKDLWHGH
ncbi:hypothetical protein [Paraglaciecola sp.]|uniref:hypothetical protein n=1 Tax=Paraglaciecola sp. TaxID=1920173 RepID=UPI003266F9EC